MKQTLTLILCTLLLISCDNRTNRHTATKNDTTHSSMQTSDSSTVYLYYFHGKQRCKTCIAVGEVSKSTIINHYNDNPNVKFVEVLTDDKANTSLTQKYEVMWNALIITKGDNSINLTQQAFANAIDNPAKLIGLIQTEIDKRLQ